MTQWGIDVLFNPSKRHLDEEKRRLQATRPVIGDNSGGKRIDLESGKVRISGKKAPTADEQLDDGQLTDQQSDDQQSDDQQSDDQQSDDQESNAPEASADGR